MSKKKAPPTPKTGKSRDDIFGKKKPQIEEVVVTAPIEQDAPPSTPQERGRPKKYDVSKHKTTVTFELEQIVALDRLCTDILSKTGKIVDRGDIIRAAVEVLLESNINFSSATSADDIRSMLAERLRQ